MWGGAILVLGILVAGLLGAAILLWRHIDIESVLEVAADDPRVEDVAPELALPALTEPPEWRAYVYVSDASARFFPDTTYLEGLATRWESLLASVNASSVRLARLDSLVYGAPGALLVVPAAVCLGEAERRAIRAHLGRGGHLLATWAIGARDGSCEWRGFDYLEELSGAAGSGTVEDHAPSYVTLPHGSVVATGLPPGSRVELENESWITLRAGAGDAFWSDRALNPRTAPGGGAAAAVITRRTGSGGRIAWFGFRLDAAAAERDRRVIDRLARNAALWAGGHVTLEVEPWPDGARAALALTQDVEHDFTNSRRLAERLQARGAPVTFFVVTRLARSHPQLAAALRSTGEIGSHGVDHRQVAGRLWGTQLAAADQAREDIRAWAGVDPVGFRPPREVYDETTLETWRRRGGLYVAASNGARSAAPEIFDVGSGRVVVLPRVVDDDYTVMVVRGAVRSDSLEASLMAALAKMRALGGLDLITLHSQLIDSESRVGVVESAIGAASRAGDVWVARAADIADWWLRRADLEVRARSRSDGSLLVNVQNRGEKVTAAWLRLHLPDDPRSYAAPESEATIPEARLEEGSMRIALPVLKPGEIIELLVPRRSPGGASESSPVASRPRSP
jgi:peptidoglycan/xylan/chitin deacetylase (PgdA/CDA1 family)